MEAVTNAYIVVDKCIKLLELSLSDRGFAHAPQLTSSAARHLRDLREELRSQTANLGDWELLATADNGVIRSDRRTSSRRVDQ